MLNADISVDILIAGAGGAGLAAAIRAHDLGADVAVVEKLARPGGNTGISTGSVPGAGTRFQKAAGIADDGELFARDLLALSGPHEGEHLVAVLARRSAELVEWLHDAAGVRLDIITDYKHVGHSVPRLHAPSSRKGEDLTNDLLMAIEKRGIPLALSSPMVSLVLDGDGHLEGAVIRSRTGEETRIRARKLVLCTNGFGSDPELVARHCREIAGAAYVGALGSQGEAIRWGEEVGAAYGNLRSYQAYATIIQPHGELLSWTTIEKGAILVNAEGERFGNEPIGYSGYAAPVKRQGGPVTAIFDDAIHAIAAKEPWFKEVLDYGGARRAQTLDELADAVGLDRRKLAVTLADYNDAADGKKPDIHGRTDFGVAPLKPPFWFTSVLPGLLSTQGGLMVDDMARVLDQKGAPIPHLFAAGGAAVGISGLEGGVGYASGSGLLHAIGMGWIAAETAVAELGDG